MILHVVRLSVCPSLSRSLPHRNVYVPCSNRLEFFQNNFTAEYLKAHALVDVPKIRVEWDWGQEHIKRAVAPKRCKIGPKLLLRTTIGSRICAVDWHQNQWPWMPLNGRNAPLADVAILAQSSADFALTCNFQVTHRSILGASCGHLCDSVIFLLYKLSR